jgi:sugar transferase
MSGTELPRRAVRQRVDQATGLDCRLAGPGVAALHGVNSSTPRNAFRRHLPRRPLTPRRLRRETGITGMWQVNGRWELSWDETVRVELRYVENWSFALDIQILWTTCVNRAESVSVYHLCVGYLS